MLSFWWNFHHWLHRKLSKLQLPVQPVMKIASKWWHFHFGVMGPFQRCLLAVKLRALQCWPLNKMHIFESMVKIFCVKLHRLYLKFHTNYLAHALKDTIFIQHGILRTLKFQSPYTFLKCSTGHTLNSQQTHHTMSMSPASFEALINHFLENLIRGCSHVSPIVSYCIQNINCVSITQARLKRNPTSKIYIL